MRCRSAGCATRFTSSGVTKSVGSYLIEAHGVSSYWMPAMTGLVFVPLLVVGMAVLAIGPALTATIVLALSRRMAVRPA